MRSCARLGAVTPDIRYANNGEVHLAYQVLGDGPIDLVYVAGALTNLALAWEQPGHRRELKGIPGEWRLFAAT